VFSRKLKRGLPLWRVDPDARWMVKQVERYSRKRRLVGVRLKVRQNLNKGVGLFMIGIGFAVLTLVFANLSIWAYYNAAPIELIALFSRDEATLIGNIRKAGCAEPYMRYVMQGPYGEARMMALKEFRQCSARGMMDHPA
jgi:hypothetical protein